FSANSAEVTGGGIFNEGNLTLNNTIVANSSTGGDCVNASSGAVTSQTHNLIEDSANACGISHGTNGTIVGQDPLLGPLQDNGGPAAGAGTATHTHALLAGSPAIDGGDNAICAAAPVNNLDQRGTVRPQGTACDIGAVEVVTTNLGEGNQVSQDGMTTSYNPTPTTCANLGELPIHTLNPTLSNSSSDTFSDLYFALTALEYVEPQGDYQPTLCNADGGNGGRVDARLSLPLTGDLADNLFAPTESTTFALEVGLPVRKRYRILGSLYGSPVNNNELVLAAETVQAGEVTTVQQLGIFVWEFDDEGNLVDSSVQIFLPLVVR
ncbi:MAG: hypothetical protein KDE19_19695, partial [Caldilineaceae bacterium]|nr:hypothetical protein [Caldilineaceae bacterium]